MARVFKRLYKDGAGETTGHAWCVDYWIGKKRVSRSFGQDKRQAELYASEIKRKRIIGDLEFIPSKVPVGEFIQLYLDRSSMDKAVHTHEVDICRLRRFLTFLESKGIIYLKDLNWEVMEDFKRFLLEGSPRPRSPQTFNHYLTLIKTMLNMALKWKKLAKNPLTEFKKLKTRNTRQVRYFDDLEIIRILNVSDECMQNVIKILLHTGLRRSELVYLEWDDVKLEEKLLHVQCKPEFGFHTKSDKPRSIPINSELEAILNNLPVCGRFVFDNGQGKPLHCPDYYTDQFMRILKKAGITNGNLHTLRHTFVSRLVMAGADLTTVKELSGHASIITTMRYAHLSPDHKAKTVELLCTGALTDAKQMRSDVKLNPPSRNSLGYNSGGWI
jgi:integrase